MNKESAELLELLQRVRKYSRGEALAIMKGLTGDGQRSMLIELRRMVLEARGQRSLPIVDERPSLPVMPLEAPVRPKKVPYSLLLPPTMLEALKALSDKDGSPVSHHIRLAIKAYLARAR